MEHRCIIRRTALGYKVFSIPGISSKDNGMERINCCTKSTYSLTCLCFQTSCSFRYFLWEIFSTLQLCIYIREMFSHYSSLLVYKICPKYYWIFQLVSNMQCLAYKCRADAYGQVNNQSRFTRRHSWSFSILFLKCFKNVIL